MQLTNADIKRRFEALGGAGSLHYVAAAFGITPSGLSQRLGRPTLNTQMLAVLEMLETMPVDMWPERWRPFKESALKFALEKAVSEVGQ